MSRGSAAVRYAGVAAAAILALVGVQHVVWAFSPWPLASWEAFARIVVGVGVADRPGSALTLVVAALLLLAGYLLGAGAGLLPVRLPRMARLGVAVVALVLAVRGIGGLTGSTVAVLGQGSGKPSDFLHWDLALYSPLCLLLAAAAAAVAWRGPWPQRSRRAGPGGS